MSEQGFIFEDHPADIQVKAWGKNLEEAFSQTALSLMTIISPDLKKIRPNIRKKIKIEAEDKQALLFDFLSEFLYIFDVEELIFSEILVKNIHKSNDNLYYLEAKMKGDIFDKNKHEIGTEVKAITYSFMEILEKPSKVEIKIIFDI
ncbi:MAG: archease [Promethearchaeota archaeon]